MSRVTEQPGIAFLIPLMARLLGHELRARGFASPSDAECADMLRHAIDRTAEIADAALLQRQGSA